MYVLFKKRVRCIYNYEQMLKLVKCFKQNLKEKKMPRFPPRINKIINNYFFVFVYIVFMNKQNF